MKKVNHMTTYIKKSLQFEAHSIAPKKAVLQLESYRITLLKDRLFRIEYDPNHQFEDRPTQTVWHRKSEHSISHVIKDDIITIATNDHTILIDSTKPSLEGLSVLDHSGKIIYQYGQKDKGNLLGTYRTLDMVDGAIPLEPGLLSKQGVTTYDDANSVVFEEGEIVGSNNNQIDLYIFAYGKDYEACIKDFYTISGNTPLLPKYVFGNWWSRYWNYTDQELKELITDFEIRDIPLSVCIIDMDWHITNVPQELRGGWTGYTWNKDYFPNPQETLDWLHERNLKTSLNLHPADGIRPFDDCYNDVCKTMGIDPNSNQIIDFDLTNPLFIEAYFKDVHHPLEDTGIDFWWIDWQQGTKSKMKNLDPLYALNHYHFIDGIHRGHKQYLIFSRWSKLGSHRYPIGFSGDTFSTWESLDFQPYFTATASNVGYGWWSHDIGGHQGGIQDGELYTRWVQLGVFSPVMRLHSTKSLYQRREPWRYDLEVETTVSNYLRLRHEMIPYIHTFNHLHSNGELPLIRPLYYTYTHDKKAYQYKNQFFFGSELMVRPFTSKTIKKLRLAKEKVWFKEPGWFDFFTGEHIKTPGTYTFYGSTRSINVFAKEGAIIPFATDHTQGLDDLPSNLTIHLFPGQDNKFTLIEDKDDILLHTNIQVKSTGNEIFVTITSDAKVPVQRRLHLAFRSVTTNHSIVSSVPYDTERIIETNTQVVTVSYDMITPIILSLESIGSVIDNPYNFKQTITDFVDLSELDTEVKNTIGFTNYNNANESRGWLHDARPLQQKLIDINQLPIPKYAKTFLQDLTKRAIKNDE
jgi:alpha-glucosidase (family GH31 glycosyl hydrolase)